MDLLEERLPDGHLRPDVAPEAFFDRCEEVAVGERWRVDRRRRYAGDGFDQLNLHLADCEDRPFIRMVATPKAKGRVDLDVVAQWSAHPIPCEEYRARFKELYQSLQAAYKRTFGVRLRIFVGKCPTHFDRSSVRCSRLEYTRGKFHEALRSMAVGQGDVRERLRESYVILHVIRSSELPTPLRPHYEWVVHQLTWRPAVYPHEGALHATLRKMKRATGAKIAERIQAISDALDDLCSHSRVE